MGKLFLTKGQIGPANTFTGGPHMSTHASVTSLHAASCSYRSDLSAFEIIGLF